MSLSLEEFKRRLSARIAQVTNTQPYPQGKGRLSDLGWVRSKEPGKGVLDALNELVDAANQADPRPSWEVLCEAIRQAGPDVKGLRALARDPVGLISKPALDEATGSHAFGRHFDAPDEQQLERLLKEGRPQVTSIVNEGDNGRAYLAYTVHVAKTLPGVARTHIADVCQTAAAAIANDFEEFQARPSDRTKRAWVLARIAGIGNTYDDDEYSVVFEWAAVIKDGTTVLLECAPAITSVQDFEKEIAQLNGSGKMIKRSVEEPVEAFFGSKKFVIGPLTQDTTQTVVNKMVNALDFQVGFVTPVLTGGGVEDGLVPAIRRA